MSVALPSGFVEISIPAVFVAVNFIAPLLSNFMFPLPDIIGSNDIALLFEELTVNVWLFSHEPEPVNSNIAKGFPLGCCPWLKLLQLALGLKEGLLSSNV